MTSMSHQLRGGPVTTATAGSSTNTGAGAQVSAWLRVADDIGGYDPEKFYTRAHDHHGHGEILRFKVPPDVYAQIQVMVHEDELVDYTMPADFVRDAIVHHLHRRKDQLGSPRLREAVEDLMRSLGLAELVHRTKEESERWHGINEEIDGTMQILFRDGAYAQMVVNLDRYFEFMAAAAEPYRAKSLEVIAGWRGKVPKEYLAD